MSVNIDKIISEQINRFLNEEFFEAEKAEKKMNSKFQQQVDNARERDGSKISKADQEELSHKVLNNNMINVSAIAQEAFPDHTPEGAQSQLRKHLKGEKGGLSEREAEIIRQELNTIGK